MESPAPSPPHSTRTSTSSLEDPFSGHDHADYEQEFDSLPMLDRDAMDLPMRAPEADPIDLPMRDGSLAEVASPEGPFLDRSAIGYSQVPTVDAEKMYSFAPPTVSIRKTRRRICGLSIAVFSIILAVVVLLILGLGLGLGLGLKKHQAVSSNEDTSTVHISSKVTEARATLESGSSLADSFCKPKSSLFNDTIPTLKSWNQSQEFDAFVTTTWTDGSAGGVKLSYTPDSDDYSNILPYVYKSDYLDLDIEYGVRVTLQIFLDDGYDPSLDLIAIQAQVNVGQALTQSTSVVWKWSNLQYELDANGYNATTFTIQDVFTVPSTIDVTDSSHFQFLIYMSPFNQTGYVLSASIFNSTDTTCDGDDPNYPALDLDYELDQETSTIMVQSNSNVTKFDKSAESLFCSFDSTILGEDVANLTMGWYSISRDDDGETNFFDQIIWEDDRVGGYGLQSESGDRDTCRSWLSITKNLTMNAGYGFKFSFKTILSSSFDSSADREAIRAVIFPEEDSNSPVYEATLMQNEIYEYGWNDTVVTVQVYFISSDKYNSTVFQVYGQDVDQTTYYFLVDVYADGKDTSCGFTDPDYVQSSITGLSSSDGD
ncbi:hypothetical protein BZA70DRAFT_284792 [Myxozyma melibiosi]|uniref:Uncharacterized protein n=1 Tax=Myxozyma melibiosi TaxID=54550 RepID=A0ABR1EYN6_9ASCO